MNPLKQVSGGVSQGVGGCCDTSGSIRDLVHDSTKRFLSDIMLEATEAQFRGLLPGVKVVEACDLSLFGAPVNIQGILGTIHKREALERMTSKLEVLNPHQTLVLLKNAFAIPKLQYVLRSSPVYLCREDLRIFDSAPSDSLGRVANVPLEGDVCKQAGFSVIFCAIGCRRAGDTTWASLLLTFLYRHKSICLL